jgi:hypothetical protein
MKSILRLPFLTLSAAAILAGCTKDSPSDQTAIAPVKPSRSQGNYSTTARYAGPDYSQSISLELANSMITSYLTSVNYPAADTALRSISFDADTLRSYLANSNIKTLKFVLAHRPSYKAINAGLYSGMNPSALTLVIVGQDQDDNYVLNYKNEVYDNSYPCPSMCSTNSDAYIH